jgi:hypothetical protein
MFSSGWEGYSISANFSSEKKHHRQNRRMTFVVCWHVGLLFGFTFGLILLVRICGVIVLCET